MTSIPEASMRQLFLCDHRETLSFSLILVDESRDRPSPACTPAFDGKWRPFDTPTRSGSVSQLIGARQPYKKAPYTARQRDSEASVDKSKTLGKVMILGSGRAVTSRPRISNDRGDNPWRKTSGRCSSCRVIMLSRLARPRSKPAGCVD